MPQIIKQTLPKDENFEMRQWASNIQSVKVRFRVRVVDKGFVVGDLPSETQSHSTEFWLNQAQTDPREGAIGLIWHCSSDSFGFKCRPDLYHNLTLRNINKVTK